MLIDGSLVRASTGALFDTVNPATEEVLGAAADASDDDAERALDAARRAFDTTTWSTDVALRVRCLRQLQAAMRAHAEELRAMTIAETGSPLFMTRSAQLDDPVESLGWVADLAEAYEWTRDLGTAEPMGMPARRWLVREPTGVVAAITPWNVPHQINLAKLGPALAAGNTVILKPAPDTPWCATVLGRLIADETDMPGGVVNILTSSDPTFGARLVTDARVDQVSFTGSTATGRTVMAQAAGTLKRVFLELGGKSAFVVLDDADLRGACAVAAFTVCVHAGQGCAITTRLVVPRKHFDEAIDVTAAALGGLPAGDPTDERTICGPLINARQRDRVEGYIAMARDGGGEVVVGGGRTAGRDKGFFVEPTLIVGIGNDSPVGLSGSVWSADRDRAMAVAGRLRTGTVGVNGGVWYSPDVPFGGYKQ